ncbi:hypothetical protein AVEN_152684-1 [Araneus ventricosus]|uniref:Uncharacterized protein n=1 Tax=Araneus ventricosus TaxID=182803 RepID=A0A4Y2HVS6_ARAVE|nr:hypothetical protein AVEN_152684-1 [Araneus ventricosus]
MESGIAALDTDTKSERNTQRIHLAVIWVPSTRIICLLNVNWKLHFVQAKMKETVYYLVLKLQFEEDEKPATEKNKSSASTAEKQPETYARKIKKGPHTVLLYPTQKAEEQGAERNKTFSVKHLLESSIHLLKDKIKDVRKSRNQDLVFDCENDFDVQKILASIQKKMN